MAMPADPALSSDQLSSFSSVAGASSRAFTEAPLAPLALVEANSCIGSGYIGYMRGGVRLRVLFFGRNAMSIRIPESVKLMKHKHH